MDAIHNLANKVAILRDCKNPFQLVSVADSAFFELLKILQDLEKRIGAIEVKHDPLRQ